MTILQDYVRAVTGENQERSQAYKEAESYYDGTVSERFASAKLRNVLRSTGHRGQQNYCRIVVDAVVNRLSIANIVADTQKATNRITQIWDYNDLELESPVIHTGALKHGDAYAIVWPDETGEWMVAYNSARNCGIVYDPENPRKKLYAVKIWQQDSNTVRMNVYLPDRIEKYSSKGSEYTEGSNWSLIGTEDNPFGEIPVFHFRTHRPYGRPEHFQAYGAQDDINKLLATHMFTVDYQGAPQRYALSMQGEGDLVDFGDDETDRENIASLKSEPGSLWYLKGITGVGQFTPADPTVFLAPVKALKESLAALTDTPYHYLERGLAGVSSGEALRVAEAPLLKKVADRQTSFGVTWREIFDFILRVEHISARLEVKWELVESLDALSQWDVMLKKINAGLSHRQALREAGYEENDIERIMAERAQEAQEGAYYQRSPQARVSTADNENFDNRNGLTQDAKDNGGRGDKAA